MIQHSIGFYCISSCASARACAGEWLNQSTTWFNHADVDRSYTIDYGCRHSDRIRSSRTNFSWLLWSWMLRFLRYYIIHAVWSVFWYHWAKLSAWTFHIFDLVSSPSVPLMQCSDEDNTAILAIQHSNIDEVSTLRNESLIKLRCVSSLV